MGSGDVKVPVLIECIRLRKPPLCKKILANFHQHHHHHIIIIDLQLFQLEATYNHSDIYDPKVVAENQR